MRKDEPFRRSALRYYATMLSAALVVAVLGFAAAYNVGQLDQYPDLLIRIALLLGAVNLAGAMLIFRPIRRHLDGKASDRTAFEHRVRMLAPLSGLWIAALTLVVVLGHAGAVHVSWEALAAGSRGVLLGTIAHDGVFAVYLGLYAYYLLADYVVGLRQRLWECGEALAPRAGRFIHRMFVALAAAGVAPILVVMSDQWAPVPLARDTGTMMAQEMNMQQGMSMRQAHMRQTLEMDVLGALLLTAMVLLLMARGLSRPVAVLLAAMRRVDRGELSATAPAVSDDEFGALTEQFNRMLGALRERERLRRTFSRFVPESVAAALLAEQGAIEPQEREATILFSDIERFTAIAASLRPRDVLDMLNGYFDELARIIHRHGGVITQFQGDAVLATFNLPATDPDHARHAADAALEIQARLTATTFAGGLQLRTRIGISSGPVVGGTVGGDERLGYTVHGDTVNLAARLEALNKDLGSRILVSQRTAELLGGTLAVRDLGLVAVRGFREPLPVFALLDTRAVRAPLEQAAAPAGGALTQESPAVRRP